MLTGYVLLVHGYHPYAEDGGVYVAGVLKLLHPELFPAYSGFVTEHLRFSVFAPVVSGVVRVSHLPLTAVLLLTYLAAIFATLCAAWSVAARVTLSLTGRRGATVLLAASMTVPVAGTSLILADPYLTARSISTPLCLFALAFALDWASGLPAKQTRAAVLCGGCLLLAAAFHPLMAAYGLAAVCVLACSAWSLPRQGLGYGVLLSVALAVAGVIQLRAAPESPVETWVALTRYYWFPFRWQWFEQLGLAGPLVVLAMLGGREGAPRAVLARGAIALGLISSCVAAVFSRAHYAAHLVARLQPLRCFCTVYALMLILLGVWLSERWLQTHVWRWTALLLALGSLMFYVQRSTYPATAHLELPGVATGNLWVEAFLWVRTHTPEDAVFALPAHYITTDGEDAECFRAIARRSALPDYSKDGGEAAITPVLTPVWVAGQDAQTGLDRETDLQRVVSLRPLGVDWIILGRPSVTQLDCPYSNAAVKVCRLR